MKNNKLELTLISIPKYYSFNFNEVKILCHYSENMN